MGDSCYLPPIPKRASTHASKCRSYESNCLLCDKIFHVYLIVPIYVDIWCFFFDSRAAKDNVHLASALLWIHQKTCLTLGTISAALLVSPCARLALSMGGCSRLIDH